MAEQPPTYLDEQGNPVGPTYLDENGNPISQQQQGKSAFSKFFSDLMNVKPIDPIEGRSFSTAKSLLPKMQHVQNEGWPAYLARGAYNQFIEPMGSALGLIGGIKGLSSVTEGKLASVAEEMVRPKSPLPLGPSPTRGLELPPAKTENFSSLPGWYGTPTEVWKGGPTIRTTGGTVVEASANQPAIEALLSDITSQSVPRGKGGKFSPGYYIGKEGPPELPTAEKPFVSKYPKLEKPVIDITPTPKPPLQLPLPVPPTPDIALKPNAPLTNREILNQIGNTFKTAQASIDLSAPLRQGKGLITNPEYWKNLVPMIKMYGSENFFKDTMQSLAEHPNYQKLVGNGLKLTGEHFGPQEEAFLGNWLEHIKIPGMPQTKLDPLQLYAAQVRGSDRAYTGFLNKTRFDIANKLVGTVEKAIGREATSEEIKKVTNLVNVASGRGSLGSAEKIANDMNLLFFSPRFQSSRLTMLTNPKFYMDMPQGVRFEALRAGLGMAATWGTELAVLKAAGAKLVDDPTNPDFGKAIFGKTRVDLGAGFDQYLVALSRFIQGKSTSSVSGNTTTFNEGYKAPSRMGILLYNSDARSRALMENKFSPLASLVNDWGKGKTPDGENFSWPKAIMDRFKPMFVNDLIDLAKEHPDLLGAGIGSLGLFGEGIQTYK